VDKNPNVNTVFLNAQEQYIVKSNENPDGRVGKTNFAGVKSKLKVKSIEEDVLQAPECEFVELAVWKEENKFKDATGKTIYPEPADLNEKLVTRTFRGKKLKGIMIMTGKVGHFKALSNDRSQVEREDEIDDSGDELRDGQRDIKHTSARKALLAGADDKHTHIDDLLKAIKKHQDVSFDPQADGDDGSDVDGASDGKGSDSDEDRLVEKTSSRSWFSRFDKVASKGGLEVALPKARTPKRNILLIPAVGSQYKMWVIVLVPIPQCV
jgi:hypothetical protein